MYETRGVHLKFTKAITTIDRHRLPLEVVTETAKGQIVCSVHSLFGPIAG